MKQAIQITLTFLILLSAGKGTAQTRASQHASRTERKALFDSPNFPSMEICGAVPIPYLGPGLELNILSVPARIGRLDPEKNIDLRFGGEIEMEQLDYSNLIGVPLSPPQHGYASARLNSNLFRADAVARLSMPWLDDFTPYVDLFAGVRDFSAVMKITPETGGCRSCTTKQTVSSVAQFNYGITGGVMIFLSESVKLNLGLSYSFSRNQDEIVNIKSAYVDAGGVAAENMLNPKGILSGRLGLNFLLPDSSKGSGRAHTGWRSGSHSSGRRCGGGGAHVGFNSKSSR